MTEAVLTHADIRDFLSGLVAAIELDQLRVDGMPAAKFHPSYNDSMWRGWRSGHISYVSALLSTVDEIPSPMLRELAGIAITREPEAIGNIALEIFAEAVSGSCQEERGTAELFFGSLIKHEGEQSERGPRQQSARISILQWLPVSDPLRIARDPECGYGQPVGSVS